MAWTYESFLWTILYVTLDLLPDPRSQLYTNYFLDYSYQWKGVFKFQIYNFFLLIKKIELINKVLIYYVINLKSLQNGGFFVTHRSTHISSNSTNKRLPFCNPNFFSNLQLFLLGKYIIIIEYFNNYIFSTDAATQQC